MKMKSKNTVSSSFFLREARKNHQNDLKRLWNKSCPWLCKQVKIKTRRATGKTRQAHEALWSTPCRSQIATNCATWIDFMQTLPIWREKVRGYLNFSSRYLTEILRKMWSSRRANCQADNAQHIGNLNIQNDHQKVSQKAKEITSVNTIVAAQHIGNLNIRKWLSRRLPKGQRKYFGEHNRSKSDCETMDWARAATRCLRIPKPMFQVTKISRQIRIGYPKKRTLLRTLTRRMRW